MNWDDIDDLLPPPRRRPAAAPAEPRVMMPMPEGYIDPFDEPEAWRKYQDEQREMHEKNRPWWWKPPEFDASGKHICTPQYPCHDPNCLREERVKTRRKAKALANRIMGRNMAYITLTMRHRSDNPREQVVALKDAFKRLRETVGWLGMVEGGVCYLHMIGDLSDGPYAHMHGVVELKDGIGAKEFGEVVKDGWEGITHTKKVSRGWTNAFRVSCYMTKGIVAQFEGRELEELVRCRKELGGAQKVVRFGGWYGRAKKRKPDTLIIEYTSEEIHHPSAPSDLRSCDIYNQGVGGGALLSPADTSQPHSTLTNAPQPLPSYLWGVADLDTVDTSDMEATDGT